MSAVRGFVPFVALLVPNTPDVEDAAGVDVALLLVFLRGTLPQILRITGRVAPEAEDQSGPNETTSQEQWHRSPKEGS